MKKGKIITAIDAVDKANSNLSEHIRNASDDDILHAVQYAYTDGGKIPKGDSQQPRLKVLRSTLIRERELTFKKVQGVWKLTKPGERAPRQPKGHSKTDTGNRSKNAKTLEQAEQKVVSFNQDRKKADKLASIARQMERYGLTLADLEQFMAESDAMAAAQG